MKLDLPEDVMRAAALAGEEARRAYLDTNPEPGDLDFSCPQCESEPGAPCYFQRRSRRSGATVHLARQRISADAFRRRRYAAAQADNRAFNAYVQQWKENRS